MPNWLKFGAFFIAGVGLIAYAHHVVASGEPLQAEIARDVGIALCISVLIAVLIEIGLAHQMFEKGLNAIMRQTVDPDVWEEVKQHIVAQPVLRQDFHLTMKISARNGEYVSTTTLEYSLRSQRNVLKHRVHHEIDAHRNLKDKARRYQFIKLDDKDKDLATVISNEELDADFDISFTRRKREAKVALQFLEYIDPIDTINWWMTTSTNKVFVNVEVPTNFNAVVQAHHPAAKELLKGNLAEGWTFDGVMLPGQGFEVRVVSKQGVISETSTAQGAGSAASTAVAVPAG
jgi:hypothetical protein